MPKVSIYLPDVLYDEVRRHDLPVSQLAQQAIARAIAADGNADWISAAAQRPIRTSALSTEALMELVDEDFGE